MLRMGRGPRFSGSISLGLCTGRPQEEERSRARRWVGQPLPCAYQERDRAWRLRTKTPCPLLRGGQSAQHLGRPLSVSNSGCRLGPRSPGASPCCRGPGVPVHQAGLSAPSRAGLRSAAGEGPELRRALLPPRWESANPGGTRPCREEEGQGKRRATPDICGARAKLQDRKTRAPRLQVGARQTPSPHPRLPTSGATGRTQRPSSLLQERAAWPHAWAPAAEGPWDHLVGISLPPQP